MTASDRWLGTARHQLGEFFVETDRVGMTALAALVQGRPAHHNRCRHLSLAPAHAGASAKTGPGKAVLTLV